LVHRRRQASTVSDIDPLGQDVAAGLAYQAGGLRKVLLDRHRVAHGGGIGKGVQHHEIGAFGG
jgi:hypothetical protein